MIRIKVNLRNGYYYIGKLINEDNLFLTVIDKKGRIISINKTDIVTKEVVEDEG